MLFSKDDSRNLVRLVENTSRIANALEQMAEVVLKQDGRDFIPNKEEAIANAKVLVHETTIEEVADEEFIQERNRIIKTLKEKENVGGIPFFEEEGLSAEDLEYIQE